MNLRKLGAAGLVAALVIGLSGLTATSAAATDTQATISGKVTYKNKPVVGALVSADGINGGWGVAYTDKAGAYTIERLKPGTYTVHVNDSATRNGTTKEFDFLKTYAGGTVRGNDAKKYRATAGKAVTVNIKPIAGATIKGKVVDAKNKPVKGASVYATNTTRHGYGSAKTNAKGVYVIKGLATGKVTVDSSNSKVAGSVTGKAKQGATKSVKTIKLKTTPKGTIRGTVKGLKPTDFVYLYNTKTKYAYVIGRPGPKTAKIKRRVDPGTYRVVVGGTGKASKAVTVRSKKTAKFGTLKAPAKRTKVSGTIKGSNNKALARATVWFTDKYGTSTTSGTTNAKGKYSIYGVTSGKYTVSASDSNNKDTKTTVKLTVKKGKNAKKNIKMSRGYKITGTLKYKSKPVMGVFVTATGVSEGYASGGTNPRGKFTLTGLDKGTYSLVAFDRNIGGYLTATKTVTIKSKNLKWNRSLKK